MLFVDDWLIFDGDVSIQLVVCLCLIGVLGFSLFVGVDDICDGSTQHACYMEAHDRQKDVCVILQCLEGNDHCW